jgi:hypothetical protein
LTGKQPKISDKIIVNNKVIDTIPAIVARLRETLVSGKTAFLGFDACIDSIVRIVRKKNGNEITDYFSDSDQFGEFLINLGKKSCGVELETKLSKPGGNMVITANALGNLGVKTECLGTFGFPEILPLFHNMSSNCSLHSIGETITASALEFKNSKVIMFDPGPYNNLTWERMKNLLGIDQMKEMLRGKQLISFLNWSEIENSSQIWGGFLDEILPQIEFSGTTPIFFTDFSDCSRKSKMEIQTAISLLGRFRNYFSVVLSLNQNEASLVARALNIRENVRDEQFLSVLSEACNTDILVVHRTNDSLAFDGVKYEKCETFFCKEPMILTGGGDNFNAGFCAAMLLDLNLFQSLVVANAVSGSYVKTGISPDVDNLIKFLKKFPADSAD